MAQHGVHARDAGVVLNYVATQVRALRTHEQGVREGQDDAVHQLRVACRKLRSVLGTYRTILPRESTRELCGELKWLGSVLAPARDGEVLQENLLAELAKISDEADRRLLRDQFVEYFTTLEVCAESDVMAALDSARFEALRQELTDFVTTVRPRKSGSIRDGVRRADRQLRVAFAQWEQADDDDREKCLHEVRKQAKQASYAADVAGLTRWRSAVKEMLSTLGEYNDCVVASVALLELRNSLAEFGYGVLYGHNQARAAELERIFLAQWQKFDSLRRPRWVRKFA
jgi:CHAD domain-containing protein